ncbi:hypothetical protein DSO57_1037558 [Entomophthora muscae]|uniref:Uncharacterized protein n=1 Tax=Entomophthora muscae TaxID=34485 RepID=A0ACC2U8B9_9FUNG|nr:hypothetical protein DSO57_1037558 [Entomophthora muscae]
MSIAVNLQLVYVHEYEFNPTWEQLYWVVSFVLATLSALAAPGVCLFGSEEMYICLEGENNHVLLFEMCLYSFWILVPLIYSSVAITFVICKLARHKRFLSSLNHPPAGTSFITTLMFRVSALYSIIPTFTKGGLLLLYTYEGIAGQHEIYLFNAALVMSAFLIDPGFKKAYRALKTYRGVLSSKFNSEWPSTVAKEHSEWYVTRRKRVHNPYDTCMSLSREPLITFSSC